MSRTRTKPPTARIRPHPRCGHHQKAIDVIGLSNDNAAKNKEIKTSLKQPKKGKRASPLSPRPAAKTVWASTDRSPRQRLAPVSAKAAAGAVVQGEDWVRRGGESHICGRAASEPEPAARADPEARVGDGCALQGDSHVALLLAPPGVIFPAASQS